MGLRWIQALCPQSLQQQQRETFLPHLKPFGQQLITQAQKPHQPTSLHLSVALALGKALLGHIDQLTFFCLRHKAYSSLGADPKECYAELTPLLL